MRGNYQKITVKMKMESRAYRLWKNGIDEAVCILETYKDKRSIYFSAANLMPSHFLRSDDGKEFHVILLGTDDNGLIHKDFGVFYVNQKGEGSFFQKFSGPALSCYTHCLLTASKDGSDQLEIIYSGETPYFEKEPPKNPWQSVFDLCDRDHLTKAFSTDLDETEAEWYRIEPKEDLPEALCMCKPLIEKYRHYIIGKKEQRYYVGIPGRFLQKEQPCREEQLFLLWQPLRGGEEYFDQPEKMEEDLLEEIFGYWIAEIDIDTGNLCSV